MSTAAHTTAAGRNTRSITAVMIALLAACFAFQLNASMLSPALVLMQKELHTTASTISLSQTMFFTAAALFSLFLPRLGDMIGRRKLLVGMMILTALGCALSALSGTFDSVALLFVGRIIQGVAGPTVPVCLIILRVAVTDDKHYGTLLGVITAVNGGIAGIDALAGGWLAQNFGFASVFAVMAVIAVLATICVATMTDESRIDEPSPMDWTGTVLLVIAVGAALTAINELGKLAGANWLLVVVLAVVTAVAAVAFWRRESGCAHPLVTTTYLKSRATWALLATTALTMTGVFAIMNGIVPAIAQEEAFGISLGADVVSFYTLTPYAIAGLIMGPIAGTLAGRYGYRLILRIGLAGTIVGVAALLATIHHPSPWVLFALSTFVGITYAGMSNIMLNGLGIVLSPEDNPGYLPGLNAGAFNLGAGISFAVLYAVATTLGGGVSGYSGALICGIVLLAGAFGLSLLIPRPAQEEK